MGGLASDNHALRHAIALRADECLQQCATLYRAARRGSQYPEIRFDLRGQTAGQCVWRPRKPPLLRFNMALAERHPEDFLTTTVAHEVAHFVTAACYGKVRPHGVEWQAVMRHLGISSPSRCHTYQIDEGSVRQQRRWDYQCDCRTHQVSTTRHKRMSEQGRQYLCRQCGSALFRMVDTAANSQRS